jgi:hypothetical protein
MIQDILAYSIVFGAIVITLIKGLQAFNLFNKKKKVKASSCGTCISSSCAGCSLKQNQKVSHSIVFQKLNNDFEIDNPTEIKYMQGSLAKKR